MDIDTVQQRTRNAVTVVEQLVARTAAALAGIAEVAARTRIHGGQQLEPGGKNRLLPGSCDRDRARLERLAQRLEDIAIELGQLVEEQHPVMGTRHFAGTEARSAADERRNRGATTNTFTR